MKIGDLVLYAFGKDRMLGVITSDKTRDMTEADMTFAIRHVRFFWANEAIRNRWNASWQDTRELGDRYMQVVGNLEELGLSLESVLEVIDEDR